MPLGADLALTRFTGAAGGSPLDEAHSWGALDLAIASRPTGPRTSGEPGLAVVTDRENLAQALILRLITPRGSLAPLGHVAYGSRLGELVGRRDDAAARALARLYVLEALAAEPRVAALESLVVETDAARPDVIRIAFAAVPVGGGEPLALTLELAP